MFKVNITKEKIKKVFLILFLCIFILISIFIVIYINRDIGNIKELEEPAGDGINIIVEGISTIDFPEEIGGFPVIAKIEIPKIDLVTYIVNESNDQSLAYSLAHFWGAGPNQIGNFSVEGHNHYVNDCSQFAYLHRLSVGDTYFITDLEGNRIEYEIFRIHTVVPTNTSDVSQRTEGRIESTLITCTPGAFRRLIIRGRAI
ncbi:MAG: sortase [Oscillospiraceae bacterium]|nr:sortase [Oscillospiraceae bacterium]